MPAGDNETSEELSRKKSPPDMLTVSCLTSMRASGSSSGHGVAASSAQELPTRLFGWNVMFTAGDAAASRSPAVAVMKAPGMYSSFAYIR